MKSKVTFTKKDLIVVLCCVVFVLMNIGAIGAGGRRRAREAVCLSNLFQWGDAFEMYTNDNNGSFPEGNPSGLDPSKMWIYALHPYYRDGKLRMCPMATRPWGGGSGPREGDQLSPFVSWGPLWGNDAYPTTDAGNPWQTNFPPQKYGITYSEEDNYVSYIHNDWVRNDPRPGEKWNNAWRTANVKGAGNIPLMLDGKQHYACLPGTGQEAPQYEGEPGSYRDAMKLVCINRHNEAINGVFVDFSARKIGLKELWKLKWSRHFDTTIPPICGWPNWMRDFKDY